MEVENALIDDASAAANGCSESFVTNNLQQQLRTVYLQDQHIEAAKTHTKQETLAAESSRYGRETEYTIHIDGYTGDIGDSMTTGRKFSTWDNDNDNRNDLNCAASRAGPWWYWSCSGVRLMSLFPTETKILYEKLRWESWGDISHKIAFAEMKLRE
eukprot:gene6930-12545_t